MKRIVCFVLGLCLIFSLSCCKKQPEGQTSSSAVSQSQKGKQQKFNLIYSFGDTFNPYAAKTAHNRQICKLLFDPLVKTDNQYKPELFLAESVSIDGMVCTVKIKSATFSDGSQVTASDIVYSYSLAKESVTSGYVHSLYEVVSAAAVDSRTVQFNLSQHDPYFANLLDFPIVKSGTVGLTDSDSVELAPIGCGRYILSADRQKLQLNESYYGEKGNIAEISLMNAPDTESVTHYVEVGKVDMYYTDVSDGNIVRMSGKRQDVNLNSLVYIGINSSYGLLNNKETRYAISSAINRSEICQGAYFNTATAANGFFNPLFEDTKPMQTLSSVPNEQIIVENLKQIGYNSMDAEGYYINSSGNRLSFTLLVNSENQSRLLAAKMISQQCRAAGIEIKVQERSYEQYLQALSSGGFQLYLGEVKILPNMDMSGLVVPGSSAAYGVTAEAEEITDETEQTVEKGNVCARMMASYHRGECTIGDVAGALITEMPQIPVCYRNGLLFYSSKVTSGVEASASDIFYSIEKYTFKKLKED